MAFGFGFNKQKALSAAEKFVQQGKLQNAIAEYEKVLKADPKELTVSNTIGDLYARLGQSDKAVESFKSVGDAYAAQGFTVKAIAMYKKLTKLKPTLESVLRLAELYTQQGLFNDARAQYLQVAEEFLRSGELEQAVRIFQKTLEMDPENVAMRTRLAEVGPTFMEHVRDVCERGRLDETFVDAVCETPEVFTYGGMIAHVLTFAAHRRTLVAGALRDAGITDLGAGDPVRWVADPA